MVVAFCKGCINPRSTALPYAVPKPGQEKRNSDEWYARWRIRELVGYHPAVKPAGYHTRAYSGLVRYLGHKPSAPVQNHGGFFIFSKTKQPTPPPSHLFLQSGPLRIFLISKISTSLTEHLARQRTRINPTISETNRTPLKAGRT